MELVRAWSIEVDVPNHVGPGSYYAAIELERSGGDEEPVVSFLAIDVEGSGDSWDGTRAGATSEFRDGKLHVDYEVNNRGSFTAAVRDRFVESYSLFGRLPKWQSERLELTSDTAAPHALVPANDQRVLPYASEDAPFISCTAYVASYRPNDSDVGTLTTVRLPWGDYERVGDDVDQCDGIMENPTGRVVVGGMVVLAILRFFCHMSGVTQPPVLAVAGTVRRA